MLNWLKTRSEDRCKAKELYGAIVTGARQPAFYSGCGVEDTPEGRYEMIALHLFMVIDRLKGLTNPNSPWLGTAGELVAAAYLKAGNKAEAGRLYGQIAQGGEKVPESIRQRAVQLAGVLGVDAIDQSKDTKAK